MARGKPLERVPWRRKTVQLADNARKTRGRRTGFDRRTTALILDRDGHACVCCGITVAQAPITIHHRRNRGHGGSTDPVTNGPANGIACCWPCNGLMEVSAARATEARARGWKLVMGQDPAAVPVVDWAGRTWLLDQHGTRRAA